MSTNQFMGEDFLLFNPSAVELYHRYAEPLPIIDYHCHLPPEQIAADHRWSNLTQIWLGGDHYKWRALRSNGVPERFITGDASDGEKFQQWAATVPYLLRNPLYHWTHLELKKPFGLTGVRLGPDTAAQVWAHGNAALARPDMSCRGIARQWRVEVICTTDDPIDSLEHHARIAADRSTGFKVFPTFRPDRALGVDQAAPFNEWVDRLAVAAGLAIHTFDDLIAALQGRVDFFHAQGCRLSDHGLEQLYAAPGTAAEVRAAFAAARAGQPVAAEAALKYRSAVLLELGRLYHAKGWTMQLHLGALRGTNTRIRRLLGADAGCDTIGDYDQARALAAFLDNLDVDDRLPQTILYNLNPRDNELMATMIGNFQGGGIPGKVQYGSAWWFLDQKDGMEKQIDALSNLGLLSRFVGMLTDSRSFLSYSRHEYFRRILCNVLGREMEQGLIPADLDLIGRMVRDICHDNAARYFGFP